MLHFRRRQQHDAEDESTDSKMGLDATVEVYDISGVTSVELDAIYTSAALAQQVASSGTSAIVIPVVNYFDLAELEELTKKHLLAAGQE